MLGFGAAQAAETGYYWEGSFRKAELELSQNHYFAARSYFCQALSEAERSGQELALARKLEGVASMYAGQNRWKVASTLHRQAEKIYAHVQANAQSRTCLKG